ncbi:MAG TPA: SH3 domain-containing protein [Anaerolineales bacterium]|nr:SH3 domain-containing protein [Anaerolineales bacterium]HNO31239.1 SH3 domain-containing protein [Anaerolineales bacterium]
MNLKPYLNRFVIIGVLAVAGTLTLVTLILIGWTSPRFSPDVGFAPADLTMIPAPTHTPAASATPTVDPLATPTLDPTVININGYAQITGTGGDGLRIRSAPGLNSDTVFRGEEAEVFVVKDGPQNADGYIWWYLVAPYDDTRAGWAAADFLAVVPSP